MNTIIYQDSQTKIEENEFGRFVYKSLKKRTGRRTVTSKPKWTLVDSTLSVASKNDSGSPLVSQKKI
jgi:hypothetical protein